MKSRRLVKADLKKEVDAAMLEAQERFDNAKTLDRPTATIKRRTLYLLIGLAGVELGRWQLNETNPAEEAEAAARYEERTRLRAATFAFAEALRIGGLFTPELEALLGRATMPVHEMLPPADVTPASAPSEPGTGDLACATTQTPSPASLLN